jgi:modulator of FtsH protease
MQAWHDFFIAQVGACAALVGLLFVALSINVAQILKYPWLPARGAQTLVVLTGALLEASLMLLPETSMKPICLVLIGCTLIVWLLSLRLVLDFVRGLNKQQEIVVPRDWTYGYFGLAQIATLPGVVGAVLLYFGNLAGYYWIAGGLLATFVFALLNSWILLIEILR